MSLINEVNVDIKKYEAIGSVALQFFFFSFYFRHFFMCLIVSRAWISQFRLL